MRGALTSGPQLLLEPFSDAIRDAIHSEPPLPAFSDRPSQRHARPVRHATTSSPPNLVAVYRVCLLDLRPPEAAASAACPCPADLMSSGYVRRAIASSPLRASSMSSAVSRYFPVMPFGTRP